MKYSIQKTLASNKHSEVLLANLNDSINPGLVLVKTVLPDLSDMVMERLRHAKFFSHKNILGIVDFGKCKNFTPIKYYYASRYLPGVTLTQVLSKLDLLHKKAPVPFVLHVIFSLCSALEFIHETVCGTRDKEGILHGNICPDNILISYDGDIFLMDTGISDIITHRYTGTMLVKNTETIYHHPEARFGSPLKPSHELYSLSLLFLSLLVGKKHFDQFYDRENPQIIKSIGKAFPSIPEDVVKIITKGTRFSGLRRFTRFESINGFYHALLECSFMQSGKFMKEITSLIIYTLFNHHDDFSDTHHQSQRQKALEYIRDGNDNSLKVLLRDRLKGILPEETDKTPTDTYTDLLDEAFDEFTESSSTESVEDLPVYIHVETEKTPHNDFNHSSADLPPVQVPVPSSVPKDIFQMNEDNQVLPAATSVVNKIEQIAQSAPPPPEKSIEGNDTITDIPGTEQLPIKLKTNSKPIGKTADTASTKGFQSDNTVHSGKKTESTVSPDDRTGKSVAIFGTKTIGKNHAFSRIVTRTSVIEADICIMDDQPPEPSPPKTKNTDSTISAFDSFATLLRNPYTSSDKKYIEPFSNLLKKESNNV
jgi:hypothetical protein